MPICNRRSFIRTAAVGSVASVTCTGASTLPLRAASGNSENEHTFCAFTESFQDWSIPQVCEQFKEIGLNGLDLTLRPGGHIEPEDVRQRLPAAARAAQSAGLEISMLTTAIRDDDKSAEAILATAGQLGIRRVKLGYYGYERFGRLLHQIDQVKRRIERSSQTRSEGKSVSSSGSPSVTRYWSSSFTPSPPWRGPT